MQPKGFLPSLALLSLALAHPIDNAQNEDLCSRDKWEELMFKASKPHDPHNRPSPNAVITNTPSTTQPSKPSPSPETPTSPPASTGLPTAARNRPINQAASTFCLRATVTISETFT